MDYTGMGSARKTAISCPLWGGGWTGHVTGVIDWVPRDCCLPPRIVCIAPIVLVTFCIPERARIALMTLESQLFGGKQTNNCVYFAHKTLKICGTRTLKAL